MRKDITCGLVLFATLGLCMLAGTNREAPLVGYDKLAGPVATLEARVGSDPNDANALADLTQAYIDRGSPGLAIAAVQRAGDSAAHSPRIAHLWALALMHQGHASTALAKERSAIESCSHDSCPPWVMASAMRHERFLASLVALGVEDFRRDPEATRLAFDRSTRNLVAAVDLPPTSYAAP